MYFLASCTSTHFHLPLAEDSVTLVSVPLLAGSFTSQFVKVAGTSIHINLFCVLEYVNPMLKSPVAVNKIPKRHCFVFIVDDSLGSEGLWFRSRHWCGG